MAITLNTEATPEGIICTFADGRPAGSIVYIFGRRQPIAGDMCFGWMALPLLGSKKFFRDLNAAEYYILTWAAESEALRESAIKIV